MTDATDYVRVLQNRTGQIIGSPEAVAHREGLLTADQLAEIAEPLKKSGYGNYLLK